MILPLCLALFLLGMFLAFIAGSLYARSFRLKRDAEAERAAAHALSAGAVAARLDAMRIRLLADVALEEVRRKSGAKEVVIPGRVLPS